MQTLLMIAGVVALCLLAGGVRAVLGVLFRGVIVEREAGDKDQDQ